MNNSSALTRLWEGTEETYMHCLVEVNTRSDAVAVHDSMKNLKTIAFDKWIGEKCEGLVTEYFTPPKRPNNKPKNNNDNNKEKVGSSGYKRIKNLQEFC